MKAPSIWLRLGPYLFYGLAFLVWGFFSLGIMGGADIRKLLGLLGAVAVPLYGLFLLASVVYHTLSLVRHHYDRLLPLLLVNVIGIFAYAVFAVMVLIFAMYH